MRIHLLVTNLKAPVLHSLLIVIVNPLQPDHVHLMLTQFKAVNSYQNDVSSYFSGIQFVYMER